MLLQYLVKFKIQKCYQIFTLSVAINMFGVSSNAKLHSRTAKTVNGTFCPLVKIYGR